MGYAKEDPMIKESVRALDPFFWSDVLERTEPSPVALQIMYDARVHGFTEGFVAPLEKSERSIIVVMLAGSECDSRDHYARAAASVVSTYYGMLGRHLLESAATHNPATVVLTPRQLECLKWAREGKSSTDIGAILGISVDVVDEHIARACKRLGVRTRMQAVIAAVIRGYLDP
jgi:DNA-binding CsgD family transcriptional regulator